MVGEIKFDKYPVNFEKDDNGSLLVTFPDFPEAITFGDDQEDAIFHAENAIEEAIHARIAHKESIPSPSHEGDAFVYVRPRTAAKAVLYTVMKKQKVSKAALARRLDSEQKAMDRLINVNHNTSINGLSSAYSALGGHMVVSYVQDKSARA